ncbi:transcription antitermination factor NusB, partial [Kingella kingae]|uniref:transcription antitermination factor NusB n=1 Tax=Kingella kingae TaxID=504 RepID=UPI002351E47E
MSLSLVQKLAAQTVLAVANGKNLADELANIIAQNPDLTAQDKGMLQDLAYGCQRFLGSLRYMLGKLLNKPLDNPLLEAHLLVAIYQLNHTKNAPHAVVNEAVEHIGKMGRGQYRSFANAILRRFQREQDGLNKSCQFNAIAKFNLPTWLQNCLQTQYPKHWHNMVTAFQSHPPLTLRVNRRHMNADAYLLLLEQAGIAAKKLDDYAIRITTPVPVNQLPQFANGAVSVQG